MIIDGGSNPSQLTEFIEAHIPLAMEEYNMGSNPKRIAALASGKGAWLELTGWASINSKHRES